MRVNVLKKTLAFVRVRELKRRRYPSETDTINVQQLGNRNAVRNVAKLTRFPSINSN